MTGPGRAQLHTIHAAQAFDMAKTLNDALRRVRVEPGGYVPEMTEPDGPSTAGGVQAMQHLRLVSPGAGNPTLVFGHANRADGKAEVRTYEHLDSIHRQRFKRPIPIERASYEECLRVTKQILEVLHFQTTVAAAPAALVDETTPDDERPARTSMRVVVACLVTGFVLVGVALWLALARR